MEGFFQVGESGQPSLHVASLVGLGRNHATDFVGVGLGATVHSRLRRGSVESVFVDLISSLLAFNKHNFLHLLSVELKVHSKARYEFTIKSVRNNSMY